MRFDAANLNHVFVFPSNALGEVNDPVMRYACGSLGYPVGSEGGLCSGLIGRAYAIPVFDYQLCPLSPCAIEPYVYKLHEVIPAYPDKFFFISRLELASPVLSTEVVASLFAPLFRMELANVVFPHAYVAQLIRQRINS